MKLFKINSYKQRIKIKPKLKINYFTKRKSKILNDAVWFILLIRSIEADTS